jgi:hypothetical protein
LVNLAPCANVRVKTANAWQAINLSELCLGLPLTQFLQEFMYPKEA